MIWTAERNAELTRLWSRGASWATLEAALAPLAWPAIRRQAVRVLRLPPLPDGWVTLREAGRRAGFAWAQWVVLVHRLGVQVRPLPRAVRPGGRTGRRVRVVSWAQVERALRAWLEGEARRERVGEAARRLGVSRDRLARAARAQGLDRGPHDREVWARVAARLEPRGEGLSGRAAARLLGVCARSLTRWARAQGIGRGSHPRETWQRVLDNGRKVVRRNSVRREAA